MCARSLYPTPDLRPSSDEDILIRPEDLARAEEVFRQRGYSPPGGGRPGEAVRTWCAPVCGWSCTGASVAI